MVPRWRRLSSLSVVLTALFNTGQATSQVHTKTPVSMLGKTIEQPESFSCLWETPTGPQSAVGIWLLLTTRIEGAATVLSNVPQYEQSFSVSLFQRSKNQLEFGTGSSFADDANGELTWDGTHLKARRAGRGKDWLATELDLTYDPKSETWSGLFGRGPFSRFVTLRRSANALPNIRSALVGTWGNTEKWTNGCFHVTQLSDGSLAGWSDGLQTPGVFRYSNGLKPPTSTFEHYGNLLRVVDLGKQRFSIEFGAYSGICCSRTAIATVVDHDALVGDWQPGPNQAGGKFLWKRLCGKSCRFAAK